MWDELAIRNQITAFEEQFKVNLGEYHLCNQELHRYLISCCDGGYMYSERFLNSGVPDSVIKLCILYCLIGTYGKQHFLQTDANGETYICKALFELRDLVLKSSNYSLPTPAQLEDVIDRTDALLLKEQNFAVFITSEI